MSASLSRGYIAVADRLSLSLLERFVLWLLCDYKNDKTGQCNPSISKLAGKSGASRAGVMLAVSSLEQLGFISVERISGRGNKYTIYPPESWPQKAGEPVNSVDQSSQVTSQLSRPHQSTQFTTPVNSVDGTRQLSRPEPIKNLLLNQVKNQIKECIAQNADQTKDDQASLISLSGSSDEDCQNAESSSRKIVSESNDVPQQETPTDESKPKKRKAAKKKEPVSAERPADIPADLWEDFLRHRKAKKASVVSERALILIRNEAQKAGWTMEAAINEIILRDWIGFKSDWVNKFGYSKKNDSFNNKLPPHKDANSAMYLPEHVVQSKLSPRAEALMKQMLGDEEDIPF